MPTYQIQTPCVFNIEASSEKEAKDKLIANLFSQSSDEFYGNELVYVPYCPEQPEFMDVIGVDADDYDE